MIITLWFTLFCVQKLAYGFRNIVHSVSDLPLLHYIYIPHQTKQKTRELISARKASQEHNTDSNHLM